MTSAAQLAVPYCGTERLAGSTENAHPTPFSETEALPIETTSSKGEQIRPSKRLIPPTKSEQTTAASMCRLATLCAGTFRSRSPPYDAHHLSQLGDRRRRIARDGSSNRRS